MLISTLNKHFTFLQYGWINSLWYKNTTIKSLSVTSNNTSLVYKKNYFVHQKISIWCLFSEIPYFMLFTNHEKSTQYALGRVS